VKFESTSFNVDDKTIEKISQMNFDDSNSSSIEVGVVKATHSTDMNSKYAVTTLSDTTDRRVKNNTKSSPATDTEPEWMETLNYTIDYGDNTCNEIKSGNPSKIIFVRLLNHWKSI
jgi:hypothetical protein